MTVKSAQKAALTRSRNAALKRSKGYTGPAQALREGDMVVCRSGRMGVIVEHTIAHILVTFGAAGPVGRYSWKNLRRATPVEIVEAGLHGVGCNQMSEKGWP